MITIIIALVVVGFVLWIVRTAPVIDPWVKNVIYGVVVICTLIWVLQSFGLVHGFIRL